MAILALNNGLPAMVTNQREGRWQQIHTSAIGGKTLLIFGVGHVGGDTAKVAKSFGSQNPRREAHRRCSQICR